MPLFTVTVPVTIEVDCRSEREMRYEIERFSRMWSMDASITDKPGDRPRKVSIRTKLGPIPKAP